MYNRIDGVSSAQGIIVSTMCPHCGYKGVFESLGIPDAFDSMSHYFFGQRRCPNDECHGHIFYKCKHQDPSTLQIIPSLKIPFDKQGVPERVISAFEEAITCHSSSCYIASAILLRKTLEEICNDKTAKGSNLFKRLEALATIIVVPKELIEATQDLRLLGNDAAHLEAQTYEEIGKEEIEISIEFTKEIIKAVYQYQSLLGKLRGLKKPV